MRWLDGITDLDMNLSTFWELVKGSLGSLGASEGKPGVLQSMGSQRAGYD